MKIRPEYASLVVGSKLGVGTQGQTDRDRLAATADRVLILDQDLEHYGPYFGSRGWLRVMNDPHGGWKDPVAHAAAIAPVIYRAYGYGIRDFLTINEPIALEGLGAEPDDYRTLNDWGVTMLHELRSLLPLPGLRYWGPALSPGHQEDDGFEGYRLLAGYLAALDGVAVHNYWGPDFGFFNHSDFEWWAGRIERAHRLVSSMGIIRPFATTEFNRKVDRADPADVARYATECQRYYAWLNSLDYVVAAFTFLYCNQDPAFDDLTWSQMPGMVEAMQQFGRQSEGEWSLPIWTPPNLPVMDEPEPEPQEEPVPPTIEVQQVRAWSQYIVQEARAQNVPAALIASVMLQESGGNPLAESPMNYSGGVPIGTAKGLMQVMPFHFQPGEDPFDPATNIRVGVRVLRQGFDRWHSLAQAIAAYFGAIDAQGNITGATDATGMDGNRYVAMALANMALFDDLEGGMTEEQKAGVLAAMDHIWSVAQILRGPRLTRAKQKAIAETLENDVAVSKQAVGL